MTDVMSDSDLLRFLLTAKQEFKSCLTEEAKTIAASLAVQIMQLLDGNSNVVVSAALGIVVGQSIPIEHNMKLACLGVINDVALSTSVSVNTPLN